MVALSVTSGLRLSGTRHIYRAKSGVPNNALQPTATTPSS